MPFGYTAAQHHTPAIQLAEGRNTARLVRRERQAVHRELNDAVARASDTQRHRLHVHKHRHATSQAATSTKTLLRDVTHATRRRTVSVTGTRDSSASVNAMAASAILWMRADAIS
jgi:hypothetical protein